MTYTTRSASQAVARARLFSTYEQGKCLNFVWNALDAPQRIYCGSAIESWSRATRKVTTGIPPAGAPIYFRGGSWGHIAISLGNGWMRTTDWKTGYGSWKGSVGNCTINDLCREWYGTTANYLGWSRDLAGHLISGLQPVWHAPVPAKPTNLRIDVSDVRPGHRDTSTTTDIARFKALLWRRMSQSYRDKHWTAWNAEARGYWGPAGQQVLFDLYAWLTRSAGWKPVSKVGGVWPGPDVVRNVGGIPV